MEKEQRPLLSANWWYCAHEKDMNIYIYIAYISKRIYRYKNYAYRVFHFQM